MLFFLKKSNRRIVAM